MPNVDCPLKCPIPEGVDLKEMPPSRHNWSDIVRCPNSDQECGKEFMVAKIKETDGD